MSIGDSIAQYDKVKDYIKLIKEQFFSSNKTLASNLMNKLSIMKLVNPKACLSHNINVGYFSPTKVFGD